ncbi:MAG TPA: hypothetical protein VK749_22025 [Xanthobacteraceae bacterium]|nr:hypothetical protein [Xanthobacteraceae bacterium]
MVDELSEICVKRRDATFFVVYTVFRLVESGRHLSAEPLQISNIFVVSFAELRRRQIAEHAAETALEQGRSAGGREPAQLLTMSFGHLKPPPDNAPPNRPWFTADGKRFNLQPVRVYVNSSL